MFDELITAIARRLDAALICLHTGLQFGAVASAKCRNGPAIAAPRTKQTMISLKFDQPPCRSRTSHVIPICQFDLRLNK